MDNSSNQPLPQPPLPPPLPPSANLSKTQKMLKQLLKDPLLSDLTKLNNNGSISIEEVDTLISLENGTAFEIEIERDGLEPLIERLQKQNNKGLRPNKKISWKHIWKSYCLMFENQRLLQDKLPIQELGIRSGSVLKFSRFVRKSRKKHGIVEDNRK
ncbi:30131_t:CDS:2 [Racocetra persica]|uniref:30131_t:CDS:1 n=1 Tax=Racocetra persica TaxID=160502 RepID=A0ACA9LL69_9GLOM|nr:30131_t:CDS:2 [Racocetra persica]